jgi:hypothetical protein
LLLYRAHPSRPPSILKMVGTYSPFFISITGEHTNRKWLDDILSDMAGSDDYLGLDHINNKSRSFWSKSESFSIR